MAQHSNLLRKSSPQYQLERLSLPPPICSKLSWAEVRQSMVTVWSLFATICKSPVRLGLGQSFFGQQSQQGLCWLQVVTGKRGRQQPREGLVLAATGVPGVCIAACMSWAVSMCNNMCMFWSVP